MLVCLPSQIKVFHRYTVKCYRVYNKKIFNPNSNAGSNIVLYNNLGKIFAGHLTILSCEKLNFHRLSAD